MEKEKQLQVDLSKQYNAILGTKTRRLFRKWVRMLVQANIRNFPTNSFPQEESETHVTSTFSDSSFLSEYDNGNEI